MYQTFIILFREILEISIILGVVIAATKNIKNRNIHILLGLIAGVLGSSIIALFTNRISNYFGGTGQEIINAMILLVASGFISWTIVWMQKHGRKLSSTIKSKGREVETGEASLLSITLIIALAIFREGSEIVLFTYSVIITNKDTISQIIMGGLAGLVTGGIFGWLFYFGILKISGKYLFKVTAILLSFIAASMSSQAAMFLQSAGYFVTVSAEPLWNSSWLISDKSVVGNILNIIMGYTAKPTILEIIFYLTNLAIIWAAAKLSIARR